MPNQHDIPSIHSLIATNQTLTSENQALRVKINELHKELQTLVSEILKTKEQLETQKAGKAQVQSISEQVVVSEVLTRIANRTSSIVRMFTGFAYAGEIPFGTPADINVAWAGFSTAAGAVKLGKTVYKGIRYIRNRPQNVQAQKDLGLQNGERLVSLDLKIKSLWQTRSDLKPTLIARLAFGSNTDEDLLPELSMVELSDPDLAILYATSILYGIYAVDHRVTAETNASDYLRALLAWIRSFFGRDGILLVLPDNESTARDLIKLTNNLMAHVRSKLKKVSTAKRTIKEVVIEYKDLTTKELSENREIYMSLLGIFEGGVLIGVGSVIAGASHGAVIVPAVGIMLAGTAQITSNTNRFILAIIKADQDFVMHHAIREAIRTLNTFRENEKLNRLIP